MSTARVPADPRRRPAPARRSLVGTALAALALAAQLAACSRGGAEAGTLPDVAAVPGAGDEAALRGAGSSFVEPLIEDWIATYERDAPGVSIAYDPVGSVAGVDRLLAGEVDFATTEVPLTPLQRQRLEAGASVVQVPWVSGAVAIVYNLPGVDRLRVDAAVLAGIYEGRITRWDDPRLQAANPGTILPGRPVVPVHRAGGSGTTAVLGGFLTRAGDGAWTRGDDPDLEVPAGVAVASSSAMVAQVRATAGAIGYVALGHAQGVGLRVAAVANAAGTYVVPSTEGMRSELADARPRPFDSAASLLFSSSAPGAYPLSTPTYVVLRSGPDPARAAALRHFVEWALVTGQRSVELAGYLSTPPVLPATALDQLARLR